MDREFSRRVVITGMGVVTPAGNGLPALWQAVLEGTSTEQLLPEFRPVWDEEQDLQPCPWF